MRSVVIIGKGNSVKRSTAGYIDSFSEVAICNRPIFKGYEHFLSDHADISFETSPRSLEPNTEYHRKLGIKKIFPTGGTSELRRAFRFKNLDPSTGTLALSHYLSKPQYTKICLVGFDLFQVGSRMYYFSNEELDEGQRYLTENGTYSYDLTINIESGHNIQLTADFITMSFKRFPDIAFEIISDFPFNYVGKNCKFL